MSWRDTLYVWDGILMADQDKEDADKKIPIKWEGTWVATESADARKVEAPKRGAFDEFVESDMRFEVEGTAKGIQSEEGTSPSFKCTLEDGAGWDLGEGTEKKKHVDEVHELLMANLKWTGDLRDQRKNLIFASGKNEHGSFVSAGWTRPGNRLTLARRYLEDGDVRTKWELEDLRDTVLGEIYHKENNKVRIPPWQCETMHSKLLTGKRARESEDLKEEKANKAAKQ